MIYLRRAIKSRSFYIFYPILRYRFWQELSWPVLSHGKIFRLSRCPFVPGQWRNFCPFVPKSCTVLSRRKPYFWPSWLLSEKTRQKTVSGGRLDMSFKSLAPAYIHSQLLLSVNSTWSTKDSLHCSNLLKCLHTKNSYSSNSKLVFLNSQMLFSCWESFLDVFRMIFVSFT